MKFKIGQKIKLNKGIKIYLEELNKKGNESSKSEDVTLKEDFVIKVIDFNDFGDVYFMYKNKVYFVLEEDLIYL